MTPKKIFNLYFDPPTTKHDDMYRLCPDSDNAFIDDDDIRQSTLNLSDHSVSETEQMDFQTKRDKRQTTDSDGFTLPTKKTRRTPKRTETRDRSRSSTRHDEIKSYWNKKDFNDQETPDPLLTKPKDPRLKIPIPDKPSELEQNWTSDRIIANLPKQTTTTTVRPEQVGLILYRNTADKTTLPDIIDAAYIRDGLTKQEHGLKFSTKHTDINSVHHLLISGQIPVTADNFITLSNKDFMQLPRGHVSPRNS